MFGFLKRKKKSVDTTTSTDTPVATPVEDKASSTASDKSLHASIKKSRRGFTDGLADILLGAKSIDDDILEEIENRLLTADVGMDVTQQIIKQLTQGVSRKELNNADSLMQALADDMVSMLKPAEQPLVTVGKQPFVILVVGINGAGKTTTIGKLAKRFQNQGNSVMLAAGDTFRAAAVEQLKTWGDRNNVPVVAQGTGADSASVIFDAVQSAQAKGIDIVIADTAGRLHTQSNLMEELIKIRRVMSKLDDSAPHEVMLVMDAGFGQNGLIQAEQFHQAMNVTGLTITKLDGTAKGGILLAISQKLGLPIRFIGVGEGIEDLREFNAVEFVDALLDHQAD